MGQKEKEISDLTKKIFDKFNKLENKENTKDLKTWLESHKEIELLKDDPEMISAMKKVDEILELFKKEKRTSSKKFQKFNFFNKKNLINLKAVTINLN